MTECVHDWRLTRSTQRIGRATTYKRRSFPFFGERLTSMKSQFLRIDEYSCCKCLEEKTVKRAAEGDNDVSKPAWWSDGIKSEYLPYAVFPERGLAPEAGANERPATLTAERIEWLKGLMSRCLDDGGFVERIMFTPGLDETDLRWIIGFLGAIAEGHWRPIEKQG